MTAGIRFSGGRSESWFITAGSPVDWTGGTSFDTTYSDASFWFANVGDVANHALYDSSGVATTVNDGATLWWHAYMWLHRAGGTTRVAQFVDSAGFPWVQLILDSSNVWHLQGNTNTGASPTWTDVGTPVAAAAGNVEMDVSIAINSAGSHTVNLYQNGTLTTSAGTFTNSGFTQVKIVKGQVVDASFALSQVLATEGMSTVNGHVFTSRATGAGHYSDWVGAYTDVNEPVNSDSTTNASGTASQNQSYVMGDATTPSGHYIASVFNWVRGKNTSSSSPSNIKALARTGTTDHLGTSNLPGIGIGFNPLMQRWDTDPSTSATWTDSGFNAYEFGFQSET